MHELGIIQNIFKVVEETAVANNLSKISKVYLKVGKLRQVVPEFLQFAFATVTKDTIAEDAELVIEIVPVVLQCKACGNKFVEKSDLPLECTVCGSTDLKIVEGKEIVLDSIEGDKKN